MPIVVNSNASATTASFNLSRANDSLRKSLGRLSSGNRINTPADDAGGLSVAYKLNSKASRTSAILQNTQNSLSYLQVQDSSQQTAGKTVDRMSELRVMAQDITKNSQDIENYSKEFIELQSQLNQVSKEKFNGISLFSSSGATASGTLISGTGSYNDGSGTAKTYNTFARTLLTHDSGESEAGSVSINVVNFQFMLSIGTIDSGNGATAVDLGNIDEANTGTGIDSGFVSDITHVAVSQFTAVIEKIADMRAENGAEQNRITQTMDLLQSNLTNIEAAHGRIMDTDIALESTRFARHNILVQASAAMTAQANQLTNVALQLIG